MTDRVFADRDDAGRRLARRLVELGIGSEPGAVVLGIPRGGVRVGAVVAHELGLPLRAVIARKVGAPRQPELAIGSVGPDGQALIDESLAVQAGATRPWLTHAVADARAEVLARAERLPAVASAAELEGGVGIVVDDGVATGATAAAVGLWLRGTNAARRVLALPVGPRATLERLEAVYDAVVALDRPRDFHAVGQWYRDFRQTTDEEVVALLSRGGTRER